MITITTSEANEKRRVSGARGMMGRTCRRGSLLTRVLLLTAVVPTGFVAAADDAEDDAAAAALFEQGAVPRLEIRLTDEAAESLRRDPRAWTTCTLDDAARWRAIEARLDVEAFLTFAAVEAMTGHWDGYCSTRNNYRIYMDPAAGGRARFLPHGMDQIFGDAGARIFEPPAALVAMAVLENPTWRRRYRERVRELLPLFAAEERLVPLLDATAERLRQIVLDLGPEPLERFTTAVHDLRNLVVARAANLREQAEAPEPLVWPSRLQAAVRALNATDATTEELSIPDSQATDFLRANVPWFECPDPDIEFDYYRRWWTLRRHVRHTDTGPVVENLPPEFRAPLAEVRWLRDLRLSGLDALRAPEAAVDAPRTCDSVITGIVGLKLHPDTTVEVHPAPPPGWKWFAMDRIAYQGRLVTVVWDETGEHYGQGPGLRVLVDGHEVARSDSFRRLVGRMP